MSGKRYIEEKNFNFFTIFHYNTKKRKEKVMGVKTKVLVTKPELKTVKGVRVEVWGQNACFTRPEFKTERVSYDVITPSAAVGLLRAIYWHPGVNYVIDRIRVLNPIRFENVKRNEVREKCSVPKMLSAMENGTPKSGVLTVSGNVRQQRATMMLKDVRYVIEAHFELDNEKNTKDMQDKVCFLIRDRIKRGVCFEQPCLGMRECVAYFKEAEEHYECPDELKGERDLGFMFHTYDYSKDATNPSPRFYRAVMKDGVIEVPPAGSKEVFS